MLNFRTMSNQDKRFDLRMNDQEREALEALAQRAGKTMSKWVKDQIQEQAKAAKLW